MSNIIKPFLVFALGCVITSTIFVTLPDRKLQKYDPVEVVEYSACIDAVYSLWVKLFPTQFDVDADLKQRCLKLKPGAR
jgi:hypothetical protein